MLGPLPKLHRVAVAVVALLLCGGAGAWAAFMLPYPILLSAGAGVGLAVGTLFTYLLVRDSSDSMTPQRVRRHRTH